MSEDYDYSFTPKETLRVGFGSRVGATIIDGLILICACLALTIVLIVADVHWSLYSEEEMQGLVAMYAMFQIDADTTNAVLRWMGLYAIVSIPAQFAYGLFEILRGQSPAKRILGIVIAHKDGGRGNTKLWFTRWCVKNISAILGVIALLPALSWITFLGSLLGLIIFFGFFATLGSGRMALHDYIAGTAVYRVEDVA